MNTELASAAERLSNEFSVPVYIRPYFSGSVLATSHLDGGDVVLGYTEVAAREALILRTLRARFPALDLSFGYIGNLGRFGDERSFYVFSRYSVGFENPLSISLGSASEYAANYTVAKVSRKIILEMCRYEVRQLADGKTYDVSRQCA